MFKQIRIKFIVLSMTALFVLLFAVIAGMNLVNYKAVIEEADSTLAMMAENEGKFPPFSGKKLPPFMTPETPYETRYFSVAIDKEKGIVDTDISKIAMVDEDKAYEYAMSIMAQDKDRGFVEEYRFVSQEENGRHRITFMDMGRRMYAFQTFLKSSILIGVVGYIAFFLVIIFFSGKIMRPVADSYEKQKRFITDAGHEIKTPLAIINADVDVISMEHGTNEWLEDIKNQTKRLAGLTNDLVYLSRMEEEEKDMQMIEFPFSDVVGEVVVSFQSLAKTQNKKLHCDVPDMVSLIGNERAIRQLTNILMDNALKYSPEGGDISVLVQKQGKNLTMTVSNTTRVPIPKDKLDLIFERFYRMDPSRSTMTGGYGIGLSVAKAIVNAHNGKISAMAVDENTLRIVVVLPI